MSVVEEWLESGVGEVVARQIEGEQGGARNQVGNRLLKCKKEGKQGDNI